MMMMWPGSSEVPRPSRVRQPLKLVHIQATRRDEDSLLLATATFQTWRGHVASETSCSLPHIQFNAFAWLSGASPRPARLRSCSKEEHHASITPHSQENPRVNSCRLEYQFIHSCTSSRVALLGSRWHASHNMSYLLPCLGNRN
jgi:hypothetical protein